MQPCLETAFCTVRQSLKTCVCVCVCGTYGGVCRLLQTALHLEKENQRKHSKSLTPSWSRSSCSRPRQTHPRPQRVGGIPPCRNTSCVNIRSQRPPLSSDRAEPPPNTSKRTTPGKSNGEFLRLRSRPSGEQTQGSRTNMRLKESF